MAAARTTRLRQQRDAQRKQRTRESLLDAAEHVFADQGYHATLVGDVVARAGVGQGTFYRHFDSKRAIFEALFDRLVEGVLAEFELGAAPMPATIDEYRALSMRGVAHAVEVVQRHRNAILMFLREGPSVDRALQQRIDDMHDRMATLAEVYMRHAIASGFARPCDVTLVCHAIIGQASRILTLWLDNKLGDRTAEHITEELVDFVILGYGPRPERP